VIGTAGLSFARPALADRLSGTGGPSAEGAVAALETSPYGLSNRDPGAPRACRRAVRGSRPLPRPLRAAARAAAMCQAGDHRCAAELFPAFPPPAGRLLERRIPLRAAYHP
jgi:hypothetical protein